MDIQRAYKEQCDGEHAFVIPLYLAIIEILALSVNMAVEGWQKWKKLNETFLKKSDCTQCLDNFFLKFLFKWTLKGIVFRSSTFFIIFIMMSLNNRIKCEISKKLISLFRQTLTNWAFAEMLNNALLVSDFIFLSVLCCAPEIFQLIFSV